MILQFTALELFLTAPPASSWYYITGAPGTIRTCDPQYRKLMLYPAELRVHLVGVVCVEESRTNGLNYAAS